MKLYVQGARLMWEENLFVAKANAPTPENPNPKPKYQSTFVVEPATKAFAGEVHPGSDRGKSQGHKFGDFKAELTKAILAVAAEKFGQKAQSILQKLKAQNRLILHDGAEKGEKAGYVGNFYFNASNDVRPLVRNSNGAQLSHNDGVLYPGCYVDVVLDVWAFPKRESVNATVLAVTFNRDGERLAGGTVAAADDFEAIPAAATEKSGAAALF